MEKSKPTTGSGSGVDPRKPHPRGSDEGSDSGERLKGQLIVRSSERKEYRKKVRIRKRNGGEKNLKESRDKEKSSS